MRDGMTIGEALARAMPALTRSGIGSPALDAAVLLSHIYGIDRTYLLLNPSKLMNDKDIEVFNALVARRIRHEPIAYIIGSREFWSLDFYVTRDTLIPRPDSETLVEAALKRARNRNDNDKRERVQGRATPITLLDIGTGTGCLLVALLKELPEASGIGVDDNERALQVAEKNAKRNGVESRAGFVKSHWCDALRGTFDLILSNPPYIAKSVMTALMPDVLDFEPHSALVAGDDGLDAYRALAPQVEARLNPSGYVLFEVGQGQAEQVGHLLEQQGLTVESFEKDLAGIERCVVARKQ